METQSRYVSMLLILVSLTLFISQCDQIPPQNCSTYDTAKFIGNYNVSEFCQQGFGHGFTFATINPGNGAENELDCEGTYFRIPQQTLGSSALSVVGEGNYFNTGGFEQLQFDLQLNEFGQANYCTYTFSK